MRFDAYTATTKEADHRGLADLVKGLTFGEQITVKEGKGMHTFGNRLGFRDESGTEFANIMWGGAQQFTYIEVKGERTPE
ncbi:MAG: hypothetical protein RR878_12725, partial [Anaerorhabdus sp.]|uniref:hypothetical protein n=1 Tax=Anaerorhabdus sp. TaxID=1872524 RepID=UPI002FCBA232